MSARLLRPPPALPCEPPGRRLVADGRIIGRTICLYQCLEAHAGIPIDGSRKIHYILTDRCVIAPRYIAQQGFRAKSAVVKAGGNVDQEPG